jgi:hypothetical protein
MTIDVDSLLSSLLRIVGESEDYFVSGSLSFLPLTGRYRDPEHDVDVGISYPLFEARRQVIEAEGDLQILRLREVAIADTSRLAGILIAKTGVAHLETPDGLLDFGRYRRAGDRLEMPLGLGLAMCFPAGVLERVSTLEWHGQRFRAGPLELAFLPKALGHVLAQQGKAPPGALPKKHITDLEQLSPLVDWGFVEFLIAECGVRWLGRRLPSALDPLASLDVAALRTGLPRA